MASQHPLYQPTTGLLASICQQLAETLHTQSLWVGLPDAIHDPEQLPNTIPLSTLLDWLPSNTRQLLEQEGEICTGQDLSATVADISNQLNKKNQSSFWAAVPIPLENYPAAVVLLAQEEAFDICQLKDKIGSAISILTILIEHVLLKKTAHQYRSSMEALHTVSLRMASTLELNDVLDLMVESTLQLLPADAAHIYIYRTEKESTLHFSFGAMHWREDQNRAAKMPRPDKLVPIVAQRNWPLIIDGTSPHPLHDQLVSAQWNVALVAAYPLRRRGRLLGVFIISFLKPYTLTAEERHLLSMLTDQAAVAIDNAQVASKMSHRLTEMTTLRQLAQKVSATLDLDEVMHTTAEALQGLFNAYSVNIMLSDENQGLELAATAGPARDSGDKAYLEPGQGVEGQVVQNGEPVYIPDIRRDENYCVFNADIRSLMVVPLTVKGGVIGTLSINSEQVDAFGPDTERLLAIAAAQTAIAIENARLYQSEYRRAQELDAIIELSRLITQHLELDQAFTAAHQAIQQLMACDAFVISMSDHETRETIATYLIDKGVRYPPNRWPAGTGLSGYVIDNENTVLVGDIRRDDTPFEGVHYGDRDTIRSLIAAPLRFGKQVIGMVSAQSYQPDAYNKHDLHLLQSIGNHIAIAVENANLYADLQKRYFRLQELDRSRIEFTQNITYELRTPLTFLKAYADLLLENGLGELNEKQRQSLTVIQSKASMLARLIEDITTLETSGRDWLLIQDMDLLKIIQNAILLAENTAAEKDVSIKLNAPDTLPTVQADPDRINQVLDNLLSNALELSHPQSEIVIILQADTDRVLVSICSQGDIITKHDQERLFELFFQADQSQKGAGLGLAVVKHIVEAHGGNVWVESEEANGNTFNFTLPVGRAASAQSPRDR